MKHVCHARDCNVPVKPEMLFCFSHWSKVPAVIQRAVWRHYRVGQCDAKNPSSAWHEAASAAIGFVARLENRVVTVAEVRALRKYGFVDERTAKQRKAAK